jgi:hypothetical protein
MRRFTLATAILASVALLGLSTTTTLAQSISCVSTTIGDYTTVTCTGSDGSFGTGSSIQIGDSSFDNYQIYPASQPAYRRAAPVRASDNCYDWSTGRFVVGC